jgi:hypothetical protein
MIFFRTGMTKLFLLLSWTFVSWLITTLPSVAIADSFQSMGVVDSFTIPSTADDMEFTATGRVGVGKPELKVVSLIMELGSDVIYEGPFERLQRPDVASATGSKVWLSSGWRIIASIPSTMKNGDYELHVRAKVSDGTFIELAIDNPILKKVIINRDSALHYEKNVFWLVVILAVCSLYAAFMHGNFLSQIISKKIDRTVSPTIIAGSLVCAVFVVLVSLGITGSSLRLLYGPMPFIGAKSDHIAFSEQSIRSDEWLVFTAMSIGQMNHQPPFPVTNKNLGTDGQNMLVVGMTGVPINHVVDFAKPATWGFHLFDLKRALAWYWWFPIIGCFLALWWLFSLLIPGQWRLGAGLSLLFCLSPYTVAWSNWPVYVVMFPTVALCSIMLLLRQVNWFRLAVLAVMLGLSVAGFVLVLYPPWQVPLGFLYIAVAFGLIIRDRRLLNVNGRKIAAFALAALLAGAILLAWWIDARPAIEVILNTVYPGRRQILTGGGMSLSELLRGFSNIGSLYKIDGGFSNSSEMASFYYLYIPLIFALGFRPRRLNGLSKLVMPLLAFTTFSLFYMIFGVPQIISELTLWNRVPSQRADLALGLAYIFLCGLVLASGSAIGMDDKRKKWFAYISSLTWVVIVAYSLSGLPRGALAGLTSGVLSALLFAFFMSGIWLALGDVKKFMTISLVACAATTISFNPLNIAPERIAAIGTLRNILGQGGARSTNKRVLVLESNTLPMALLSAGVPTVNGVFYYPQMGFWRHLGAEEKLADVFNRYQNLVFTAGVVDATSGFTLDTPQADVVKVTVDAERFNFQLTGAQVVAAPQGLNNRLEKNPSLRMLRSDAADAGWAWFDVIKSN